MSIFIELSQKGTVICFPNVRLRSVSYKCKTFHWTSLLAHTVVILKGDACGISGLKFYPKIIINSQWQCQKWICFFEIFFTYLPKKFDRTLMVLSNALLDQKWWTDLHCFTRHFWNFCTNVQHKNISLEHMVVPFEKKWLKLYYHMKNTFPYHNSVNIRLAFPSTDLNKNAIELSNLQTFFLEQATYATLQIYWL